MSTGIAVIVRGPLCAKLPPLSPERKEVCETRNSHSPRNAPQRMEFLRAWVPPFRTREPRRPGDSSGSAHRMGCQSEEAGPGSFRQFQRPPQRSVPAQEPASRAQRRGRLATQQTRGRAEPPWPRPRGRCRSSAEGALGARVHGCPGARAGAAGRGAGSRSPTPGRGAGGGGGRVDTVP